MNIVKQINLFDYSKNFVKTGRVVIDLVETDTPYKYVAFNQYEDDKSFYWIAAYDWNKSKTAGYQNCKDGGFKTAKGCKKNFLKHAGLIKEKF
jgi:hypothetical protein